MSFVMEMFCALRTSRLHQLVEDLHAAFVDGGPRIALRRRRTQVLVEERQRAAEHLRSRRRLLDCTGRMQDGIVRGFHIMYAALATHPLGKRCARA